MPAAASGVRCRQQSGAELRARGVLPPLDIGGLHIDPPIIQGGMGVRVSASRLVSAVSNQGALGVIAAVGAGEERADRSSDFVTRSRLGLREMLRETRRLTDRPFAVNVMCALSNYDSLVQVSVDEGAAAVISGAGLPLRLPALVTDRSVKLIPIVSSARAADLVCKTWLRRYNRLPDALVVEGPLAGGHLGFSPGQLAEPAEHRLDRLVTEVIGAAREYSPSPARVIPVIAAGGVFDGEDIARLLRLGAAGVQMATRFVCTHECDAADEYKQAYLDCTEDDIVVIRSPVGMPARVIRNEFVDNILKGNRVTFGCPYRCLATCDPGKAGYCIAQALVAGYRGRMADGYAMCGSNAWRIDKIVSVKELVEELVAEAAAALGRECPFAELDGSPLARGSVRRARESVCG
jgi:nitronate monooxygenase